MVELCSTSFEKISWKILHCHLSDFFLKIYFVSNNVLLKNQLNKSDLVV